MKQVALISITLILSGCTQESRSVSFYREHPAVLDQRLSECVARFDSSEDCRNVKQAFYDREGTPSRNGVTIGKH
ncbi:hypothetical protein SAMN05192583_1029 [Sphingomonas gellani]|uniref:Entry exclusion lipoprotein TrbK n=1 Tax=Sphingomonas gellani TaxID=1166340 RepID=A0A1H8ATH6_9SPHN|nr:hypothetical protein SAMN05192583_1029 [Sphingomonas gellani]